jgi:hypothetical protein
MKGFMVSIPVQVRGWDGGKILKEIKIGGHGGDYINNRGIRGKHKP